MRLQKQMRLHKPIVELNATITGDQKGSQAREIQVARKVQNPRIELG